LLAYVFSHRPAPGMDVVAYEDALRRFHAELARAGLSEFVASTTYRFDDGAYSDWYLVGSSAALDLLNAAAVSGARSAAHDTAARMAADGSGKLLSLAAGEADLAALHEQAFAKPAGMSYAALYEKTGPYTVHPGAALWRRMMVLGPPPEFLLVSREPISLPTLLAPVARIRGQI
jgi:hypothetical protein